MTEQIGPRISVALATYNGTRFVGETLASILAQTYKPHEVIVIDDGSTDDTPEILAALGEAVTVITIENSGPETAKKTAIEATSGEWVAICDHDDLWDEDHLERLAALVEKYPQVTTAYSNFAEFDNAARYPDKFASLGEDYWAACDRDEAGFSIYGPDPFAMLLSGNPFFPSAGMFRRSLYDEIGGIRAGISRNPAADGDMTSRMVITGVVGCDWKITAHIRKYGGNFSGEGFKTSRGGVELLERQYAEGGIFEPHKALLQKTIERNCIDMLQAAFSFMDRDAFDFAASRLSIGSLSFGMRLRYMVFRLPDFILRPLYALVRTVRGQRG